MKKKMIIFGSVIVVLFAALIFVTSYQNNQQVTDAGNPYGQSDLHQATIDQLDDPHYQNQVQPDELSETIESGEPTTVYFYDPTCPHCQETTPRLVPLTDELGVDLKKHNLLEFQESWNTYGIESTPTVIHYEDGEEVARITGAHPDENFQAFFDQYVLAE